MSSQHTTHWVWQHPTRRWRWPEIDSVFAAWRRVMVGPIANGTDIDIPVLNRGCGPAGALCAILGNRVITVRELHAMGLVAAAYLDDELDRGTARLGRRSPPAPRRRLCDRTVDQPEPETGILSRTSIGKPWQSDGARQLRRRAPRCTDSYRVDDSSSPHGRREVQCPTSR
jgi:hypothetical protein